MDISFVILHYMSLEETIQCVASIKTRVDTLDFRIVIVDNASPNFSGALLQEKYIGDQYVTVIVNNFNLGFANGNNVGFQYAKYVLNSRFIVLLNNDTYLIQDDFFRTVLTEYMQSKFSVMGPRVYTPNASCNTNPVRDLVYTERQLFIMIWANFKILLLHYLHLEEIVPKIKVRLMKALGLRRTSPINVIESMSPDYRQVNVQLHGCCLVFSPNYVKMFDGIDSRTFMFLEEDILFTQMQKMKMVMVYNPDLKIFHLEDVSTDSIFQKPRSKRMFILKNVLASAWILMKVLKENGYVKTDLFDNHERC